MRPNRLDSGLGGYKNKDMDKDTYQERTIVMNIIREANDLLKKSSLGSLPRIDVRIAITDRHAENSLGRARLNDNIIWIPEKTLKEKSRMLKATIFHELLHAAFGTPHDEKCPLMSAYYKEHPNKLIEESFVKYALENKEKLVIKEMRQERPERVKREYNPDRPKRERK